VKKKIHDEYMLSKNSEKKLEWLWKRTGQVKGRELAEKAEQSYGVIIILIILA
jgi:hypothetical protein